MKLTYRGISYEAPAVETKAQCFELASSEVNNDLASDRDTNKIIFMTPLSYYTYRGIGYTKNLTLYLNAKLLINFERR